MPDLLPMVFHRYLPWQRSQSVTTPAAPGASERWKTDLIPHKPVFPVFAWSYWPIYSRLKSPIGRSRKKSVARFSHATSRDAEHRYVHAFSARAFRRNGIFSAGCNTAEVVQRRHSSLDLREVGIARMLFGARRIVITMDGGSRLQLDNEVHCLSQPMQPWAKNPTALIPYAVNYKRLFFAIGGGKSNT